MTIEFVKLHPNAKMPTKKHSSDFCYDMYAAWVEQLDENYVCYHTGIAVQIVRAPEPIEVNPKNLHTKGIDFLNSHIQLSIDCRARSSVWETGLILSNGEGTVDEGYIGEIKGVFFRADKTKKPYDVGDRIMQMKIGFTLPAHFEEVARFMRTPQNLQRGSKGYGSTGLK